MLSKVSVYPNPQAVPKLDSSQSPFVLVTGSSSTQPAPTPTVELALNTLSTRPTALSLMSESSTLIPAPTLQSLSFLLFSSIPSGDAVPASRLTLDPTISISIIPTFNLLDSSLGPNATPLSIAPTPLVPQPSEQAPLSPRPDYQTSSLPIEVPHSLNHPWILPSEHSTTSTDISFVIGMVFASMFVFTIVCLLILRCSRWYQTKHSSVSSTNLTQSGSFSNSGVMRNRKRMRGTLFDVETGVVENLAGIGRAASMESRKHGCRGDRRITALHMRSPCFKGTTPNALERPEVTIAPADKGCIEGHKPSKPSPLGRI